MNTDFITASAELRQNIGREHFGVASGYIDIQIGQGFQIIEGIVEGDFFPVRVVGVGYLVGHLNFIYEKVKGIATRFHDFPNVGRKYQRIAVADILCQIQRKGQNAVRRNPFPQQIIAKQSAQQIGLSASANAGNDLDLTVPHERNQLF